MNPQTLELLRCLQSGPYDAAGFIQLRSLLNAQRPQLQEQNDLATLAELSELLEVWADACSDAKIAARAMVEAADIAERDLDQADRGDQLLQKAVVRAADGGEPEAGEAVVHAAFGELCVDAGDLDGAIAAYEQALEADASEDTIGRLADLFAKRKAPGDAQQAADLYSTLGDALGAPAGIPMLERALQQVPGHPEAKALLDKLVGPRPPQARSGHTVVGYKIPAMPDVEQPLSMMTGTPIPPVNTDAPASQPMAAAAFASQPMAAPGGKALGRTMMGTGAAAMMQPAQPHPSLSSAQLAPPPAAPTRPRAVPRDPLGAPMPLAAANAIRASVPPVNGARVSAPPQAARSHAPAATMIGNGNGMGNGNGARASMAPNGTQPSAAPNPFGAPLAQGSLSAAAAAIPARSSQAPAARISIPSAARVTSSAPPAARQLTNTSNAPAAFVNGNANGNGRPAGASPFAATQLGMAAAPRPAAAAFAQPAAAPSQQPPLASMPSPQPMAAEVSAPVAPAQSAPRTTFDLDDDEVVVPRSRFAPTMKTWLIGAGVAGAAIAVLAYVLTPKSTPKPMPVESSVSAATASTAAPAPVAPPPTPTPVTGATGSATAATDTAKPAEPSAEATPQPTAADKPDEAPTPVKKSKATPEVEAVLKLATIKGGKLTDKQLADALEKATPKIERCYAQTLKQSPNAKGRLTLGFSVTKAGKASGVKKISGTIKDAKLYKCTAQAITATKFAKPANKKTATIKVPFDYRKG